MAYTYQIDFEIGRDHLGDLSIGSPLQRVLSFLRAQLPSYEGFITSRARYSLEAGETVLVVVESVWDDYGSLETHRKTSIAEDKVLKEFGGETVLRVREFSEVD